MEDTIFALSSGAPPAAIGVIRISGPEAGDALAALAGAGAATYAGVLLLAWPDVVRSGIAMLRRRPTSPMPPASGPVPVGQTSTIVD